MPGPREVAVALLLIALAALLSWWRRQRLEKSLLIGALRTLVQLVLLGHVLTWVFANDTLAVVLLVSAVMTGNAAFQSLERVKVRHVGLLLDNLVAIAVAIWPLAFLGAGLLHARPLWRVDTFLPLLGMLLGNTLSGISLGVDVLNSELKDRHAEVTAFLALGATAAEATTPIRDRALKLALTPTLNSMATSGIVSIPGMMTGQILAGSDPRTAAVTQVIIMLQIAAGTYAGASLALTFARRKKFTRDGVPCFG
jgi:putative ABC transport system permease protein